MSAPEGVPFAEHPLCDPSLVLAVEEHLQRHLLETFSWQTVLDNTITTRPKEHGGPVVQSISDRIKFSRVSSDWTCQLDLPLPPTFAIKVLAMPADQVQATATAPTKKEAQNRASRKMFALLLLADPGWVMMHTSHWKIPPQQLIDNMPGGNQQRQVLPARLPRVHGDPAAAAAGLTSQEVDARVENILRRCLDAYGGLFDPSDIDHDKVGLGPEDEPVHQQLHSLIGPGQLRSVIGRLPGISWRFRHPDSKSSAMIVIDTTTSDVTSNRSELGIYQESLSGCQVDTQPAIEPCESIKPGLASFDMVPGGI